MCAYIFIYMLKMYVCIYVCVYVLYEYIYDVCTIDRQRDTDIFQQDLGNSS